MDDMQKNEIDNGTDVLVAKQKVASEFAAECAIIKVVGSEVEQFVVDEALQMHGGMGYSGESEISILYKNIRGNRIYEGTNEINRLVITGTILKKGFKGELPLMEHIMANFNALKSGEIKPVDNQLSNDQIGTAFIQNAKKVLLLTLGMATQKYQAEIKNHQEILSRLSNLIAYTYHIEAAILRAKKRQATIHMDMALLYLYEKADLMKQCVKEVVFNCKKIEKAAVDLKSLNDLLNLPAIDIIGLRQKIAQHFIEQNDYKL